MTGRHLTTTAFLSVMDWATPQAEATGVAYRTRTTTITGNDSVLVLQIQKEVGEEWLIEVLLHARLLGNGDIRIDGEIRLYEGVGTLPSAPQSERLFTLLALQNRLTSRTLTISKGETNEDFATITVSFVNRQDTLISAPMPTIQRRLASAACSFIIDGGTFVPEPMTLLLLSRTVTVTNAEQNEVLCLEGGQRDRLWLRFLATAFVLTNGDIRIEGDARLFLASEATQYNLVGQHLLTALAPREQSIARIVTVRPEPKNAKQKGGDFVVIALNFRNEAL